MVTLAITFSLYLETKAWKNNRCDWPEVPPYILPLLCLSKRLHSIYVLRLFNDCWTQLFVLSACWLYIKRRWTVGSLVYALALSVKMNALLYLPGILTIITLAAGLDRVVSAVSRILETQVYSVQSNSNWRFCWHCRSSDIQEVTSQKPSILGGPSCGNGLSTGDF